jgi:alpha-glucosidase
MSIRLINSGLITGGLCCLFGLTTCSARDGQYEVHSPNQKICVRFQVTEDSMALYQVLYQDSVILPMGGLGLSREDADFKKLALDRVSGIKTIEMDYTMVQGKKHDYHYEAIERVFDLINETGGKLRIVFRVSNDGIAFRYVFPETSSEIKRINREISRFRFLPGTKAFLSPMSAAKSGWNQVNPSYEEHYTQGIPIESIPFSIPGWVLPALFQSGDYWFLITETAPDRNYCGCRLQQDTLDHSFHIDFPQAAEKVFNGPVNPESRLPWSTPWRILAIGKGLKVIAESTLGTDLAEPSKIDRLSWIKPGHASWSWALLKDQSVNEKVQREFIDYAAEMGWEYCLVDVNWDTQIGYEKMNELSEYAQSKGVGLILWYNSAGDWNTTPYHPKNKLLTHEDRISEFGGLKTMGIRGVKVDFFGGDGQSVMSYYQDIFEDAAQFELLVNCHGATLPRGWHRTYPNLLTIEAVRGFEYLTFEQFNTDLEAIHSCFQPFTRNVFDPMDFTPVCFSEIPGLKRITTQGFQIALPVIFWSGIQHFAETPEGMSRVPDYVKAFMREVPVTWDESRFIDGSPGKLAVFARRSGEIWYVAGINGENAVKDLKMDLSFIKKRSGYLISDGENYRSFRREEIELNPKRPLTVQLKGNGGFVMVF